MKRSELSYALACAFALVSVGVMLSLPPSAAGSAIAERMLSIHLVMELFAIVIAMLVVVVSLHTLDATRDRAAHVLATGFIVVSIADLLHALSYRGMPTLLTPSATDKAIFFWLAGRSAEVLTLGLIAFGIAPRLTAPTALGIGLGTAAVIVWIGAFHTDALPTLFVEGQGVTHFKAVVEVVLASAFAINAVQLRRRAIAERDPRLSLLALSSFVMGVGELAFTRYQAPSDFQNIFGHLYKIAAYALLYVSTFRSSIRAPFRALRQSEQQLRAIADNLPNSVVFRMEVSDEGQSLRYLYLGGAIESVNRVRAEDALRDASILFGQVHPDDRPTLVAARRRALQSMSQTDARLRMRVPRADDPQQHELRTMWVRWTPSRTDDGRLVLDGIEMDITEWLEAENSRKALQDQLQESQKMESIGTLSAGIAHDFNNIVGAILGNARLASEALKVNAVHEVEFGLQQVSRAGARARDLIRQILTFGRRQPAQKVEQRLGPVVDESVSLLRSTLPARVVIVVDELDAGLRVLADGTQLQQVILNLCTNAWQAMGERCGRIELRTGRTELSGERAARLDVAPGAYAYIAVKDDGAGMDEATRQRIFQPFFTTKAASQGTGLGLAVVHGIVRAHEGAIEVASQPGLGSEFTVYLPALASPAPAAEAGAAPGTPASRLDGHGAQVLYVDDDEIMTIMVERLLSRHGFRVTCEREPAAALALLRADPRRFDIVVTDFNMPQHSGLDVIQQVRDIRADLPTLLTSGSAPEELLAKAGELGVHEVVGKQNAFEELPPAIARALARA